MMPQYLLLLHEEPADYSQVPMEQLQQIIDRYRAWREQVSSRGQLTGGEKLRDEGGRSLAINAGKLRVVDGPYAEAKEVIGGFFMIEADDYDAAIEISRSCPHLELGGRIELREIEPT